MSLSHAILFAVLYGDIFSYSYTIDELLLWLPFQKDCTASAKRALNTLIYKKKLARVSGYVTLPNRKKIAAMRKKRLRIAKVKEKVAKKAGRILWFVPTICMVGITGGLAMDNSDSSDDIDLFIMAEDNTLWVTRFLATILIELSMRRRRPGEKNIKDAICLNMYVTKKGARIPKEKHDLYTAHEILQMKPLWERRSAYRIFLTHNRWVKKLFPLRWNNYVSLVDKEKGGEMPHLFVRTMRFLDAPFKYLQLWYMGKRKTHETVTDDSMMFHPHDAREWAMRALKQKLHAYKYPPLDKTISSYLK